MIKCMCGYSMFSCAEFGIAYMHTYMCMKYNIKYSDKVYVWIFHVYNIMYIKYNDIVYVWTLKYNIMYIKYSDKVYVWIPCFLFSFCFHVQNSVLCSF